MFNGLTLLILIMQNIGSHIHMLEVMEGIELE